jgi:hypothetical protein
MNHGHLFLIHQIIKTMNAAVNIRSRKSLTLIFLFPVLFFTTGCGQGQRPAVREKEKQSGKSSTTVNEAKPSVEKLVKQWETPAVFKTPESVCYDLQRKQIYVSNINGKAGQKDGNGFISLLNPDGTVKTLEWITGLNAPKGLGIYGHDLYVADIDEVIRIDIDKGLIIDKYKAPGATFLNDIAIDGDGGVYISDTGTHRVYILKNGKVSVYLDSEKLAGANGLFVEDTTLLIGTNDAVYRVTLGDKDPEPYIENTGSIDGLEGIGHSRYLYSDWQGHVYLAEPGQAPDMLLDTTPHKINAADIDYVATSSLLLIPTFSDNRVMAYEVIL